MIIIGRRARKQVAVDFRGGAAETLLSFLPLVTGITPLADDAPGRPIEASQSLLHYRNPHPHPQTDRLDAVWRPCRRPSDDRDDGRPVRSRGR
jgi:hypothetical protein